MLIPYYGNVDNKQIEQNGGMVLPIYNTGVLNPGVLNPGVLNPSVLNPGGLIPLSGPIYQSGPLNTPVVTSNGQLLGGPFSKAHIETLSYPIPLYTAHPRLLISETPVSNFKNLSNASEKYKELVKQFKDAGFKESPTEKINNMNGYIKWKNTKIEFKLKDSKDYYFFAVVKPNNFNNAKAKVATFTAGKNYVDNTNQRIGISVDSIKLDDMYNALGALVSSSADKSSIEAQLKDL